MANFRNLIRVCVIGVLFLQACGAKEKKIEAPSTDMARLRATFDMEIPGENGRFEIFPTPETNGTIPGPTYAVTMVAEFDVSIFDKAKAPVLSGDPHWLVPNAIRPWLSEPFRILLEKYTNKKYPLSEPNCAVFSATLTESRDKVYGFQCFNRRKLFVYLPIWAE